MPDMTKEMEAFSGKFMKNHRVDGFGLETTSVLPCCFCAEPDFMRMPVAAQNDVIKGECKSCGRSAEIISSRDQKGVSFVIVQTGGDDPPAWLEPRIQRKIVTDPV